MFTITTTYTSNAQGAGRVVAKGHGKQRTVPTVPEYSPDQNHAAACGALLNVLTDERQQSMLRHPSAKQRVRVTRESDAGGKRRWAVNV
ncbi:MAG TPA: hypothetical protein VGP24_01150 [Glaciihabitans sp.]|jgi:hypothetical protein|nr:hypothetical protein [Glaciihabitans sp.]